MTAMTGTAANTKETQERMEATATAARVKLAARCHDADELRELGLMLGLLDRDPGNNITTATPWDATEPPDRTTV